MDNPGARELNEMVRRVKEEARRARSGEPSAEDYLSVLTSDPTTQWFTELLREKNQELERERQEADKLSSALRTWRQSRLEQSALADQVLLKALEEEFNI
jgi:hypothetical protein